MPPPRQQVCLSKKQEALKLLGAHGNVSFSDPVVDQESGKRHTNGTVALKFGVSRSAVAAWRNNYVKVMSKDVTSRRIAKTNRMRDGNFPKLETALVRYIRECVRYMNNQTLFREDVIRAKALQVRDEMCLRYGEHALPLADVNSLKEFKASSDSVSKFMKRNNLTSKRAVGDECFISPETLEVHRIMLKKKLALFPIYELANTDEVAVLYRCLPSRAVHENTGTSSFVRVKDRITVVLTVFANGDKAPLKVIGKSKRPRSFPRHLNPARNLGLFYYAQENAWNTQDIWGHIVTGFDKMADLQGRKVVIVLDNCSAHSVDYDLYSNISQVFLPPNNTSSLQPVDCAIGRSFKCASRRLLVANILKKVNCAMSVEEVNRVRFKITEVVTAYDALRIILQAWDLVPKRVVLKAWLKTDILSTPQRHDVENLLTTCGNTQEPASPPQYGRVTETEACAAPVRSVASRAVGLNWLTVSGSEINDSTADLEES